MKWTVVVPIALFLMVGRCLAEPPDCSQSNPGKKCRIRICATKPVNPGDVKVKKDTTIWLLVEDKSPFVTCSTGLQRTSLPDEPSPIQDILARLAGVAASIVLTKKTLPSSFETAQKSMQSAQSSVRALFLTEADQATIDRMLEFLEKLNGIQKKTKNRILDSLEELEKVNTEFIKFFKKRWIKDEYSKFSCKLDKLQSKAISAQELASLSLADDFVKNPADVYLNELNKMILASPDLANHILDALYSNQIVLMPV